MFEFILEKDHTCAQFAIKDMNSKYSLVSLKNPNVQHHKQLCMAHPKYECHYCGKVFKQICSLSVHLRVHTGERPFSCTFCEKSFTQIGNLKTHYRKHTGEKPFACTLCPKAFTQKIMLKSHMKNRHKDKNLC